MAAAPDPLQLQVPEYPDETDRDLPTANDIALDLSANQDLFALLEIPPFDSNDEWIQESVRTEEDLIPLVHIPINTCYRNAALAALMNISPFINFLQRVLLAPHARNIILPSLANLSVAFWESSPRAAKFQRLVAQMGTFWDQLITAGPQRGPDDRPYPAYGTGPNTDTDDPSNLILYLFGRITDHDLSPDQLDPASEASMIDMFKRLFGVVFISRTPYRCECGNIKRRQAVENRGFMLNLTFGEWREIDLQEIISANLWRSFRGLPKSPLCSVCGAAPSTQAEFYKLAYLPEVLIFEVSYVDAGGRNVAGARITYPDTLDMTNVRDDPDGRASDRNCLYKLKSMVVSPNERTNKRQGTHFTANLRRDETTWTHLDDAPRSTQQVTLGGIRRNPDRPRLLMYVRIHPRETEAQGQDESEKTGNGGGEDSTKVTGPENGQANPLNTGKGNDGSGIVENGSNNPESSKKDDQGNGPPEGGANPAAGGNATGQSGIDNPTGSGPGGPIEDDQNLYPPIKTLPPAQLMNIIRAAGFRRERASGGRGSRGSLGGIRRSARDSLASSRRNPTDTS